jgi:hypothetical protein
MKKILFLLLISSPLVAGPLDILDMKGNMDGRFERDSDISNINMSMDITQGVRFVGAPWVEPYLSFSKFQQINIANTEYIAMGARNKTFIPPLTFGLEYRNIMEPINQPNAYMWVGYVSVYKEWDFVGKNKDDE